MPVEGDARRCIKKEYLDIYLRDDAFARDMAASGDCVRCVPAADTAIFSTQQALIEKLDRNYPHD